MRQPAPELLPVLNDIADWYEGLTDVVDEVTLRQYQYLQQELSDNYHDLTKLFRVEMVGYDPYPTSRALWEEMGAGTLKVYTGGAPHPVLKVANYWFRAEHDYLHYIHRLTFNTVDELRVGLKSVALHPEGARAILTETCGQAAWYWRHHTYAPQRAALFPMDLYRRLREVL